MNRPKPPPSYDNALDALSDIVWTNPDGREDPMHLQVKKLNMLPSPLNVRTATETIYAIREKAKLLEDESFPAKWKDDLKFFIDQTINGILIHGMKWYIKTVYNPLGLAVKGATYSPELFSEHALMLPLTSQVRPPKFEESPLTFHQRGSNDKAQQAEGLDATIL